jgi:ribosome biogenesis protein UTP30
MPSSLCPIYLFFPALSDISCSEPNCYHRNIKFGTISQSTSQLLANLEMSLPAIIKRIEGGWSNIQSLHVKTSSSTSLPVWTCPLGDEGENGRWEAVGGVGKDRQEEGRGEKVVDNEGWTGFDTEGSGNEAEINGKEESPVSVSIEKSSTKRKGKMKRKAEDEDVSVPVTKPKKVKASGGTDAVDEKKKEAKEMTDEVANGEEEEAMQTVPPPKKSKEKKKKSKEIEVENESEPISSAQTPTKTKTSKHSSKTESQSQSPPLTKPLSGKVGTEALPGSNAKPTKSKSESKGESPGLTKEELKKKRKDAERGIEKKKAKMTGTGAEGKIGHGDGGGKVKEGLLGKKAKSRI